MLGFKFKKINGLESDDAFAVFFLNKENIMNVVWVDETWMSACHSKNKVWTDGTLKRTMSAPNGWGVSPIICHVRASRVFSNCMHSFFSNWKRQNIAKKKWMALKICQVVWGQCPLPQCPNWQSTNKFKQKIRYYQLACSSPELPSTTLTMWQRRRMGTK